MLDKKDAAILAVLNEYGRLSTQGIAKNTGIPITTVHHRIKRMEKGGIIKGYTVVVDNKKIGKTVSAYIFITVDYKILKSNKISQHELTRRLRKYSAVQEACMMTGDTDIILKVCVSDVEQLDDIVTVQLRNINGVEKTKTAVILNET